MSELAIEAAMEKLGELLSDEQRDGCESAGDLYDLLKDAGVAFRELEMEV